MFDGRNFVASVAIAFLAVPVAWVLVYKFDMRFDGLPDKESFLAFLLLVGGALVCFVAAPVLAIRNKLRALDPTIALK